MACLLCASEPRRRPTTNQCISGELAYSGKRRLLTRSIPSRWGRLLRGVAAPGVAAGLFDRGEGAVAGRLTNRGDDTVLLTSSPRPEQGMGAGDEYFLPDTHAFGSGQRILSIGDPAPRGNTRQVVEWRRRLAPGGAPTRGLGVFRKPVCSNKRTLHVCSMESGQVAECLKHYRRGNRQRARPGPTCGAKPDAAISVAPLCTRRSRVGCLGSRLGAFRRVSASSSRSGARRLLRGGL